MYSPLGQGRLVLPRSQVKPTNRVAMTDIVAAGFNPPSMVYPGGGRAVGTSPLRQNEPYLRHSIKNLGHFIGGLKPAATKWVVATRLVLRQMKVGTLAVEIGFPVFIRSNRPWLPGVGYV